MELVLKLPQNKLPFIGILYVNEYAAGKENRQIVEEKIKGWEMMLHPKGYNLHLKIKHRETGAIIWYKDIRYSKAKLDNWLQYVTGPVNFGHVTIKESQHVLARTIPGQQPFTFRLERVYYELEY